MTRPETEREYWDKAALDDTIIFDDWLTHETQEAIYTFLKWNHGENVLELGCGTGRLLNYVARSLPNRKFHGIDISREMLRQASADAPENVKFSITDGLKAEIDTEFDTAFCVTVFQHLKPDAVQSWFNEVGRLLKPNGKFLFQFIEGDEHEPFSNHYQLTDIVIWLAYAGFVLEKKYNAIHESWTWVEAVKQ